MLTWLSVSHRWFYRLLVTHRWFYRRWFDSTKLWFFLFHWMKYKNWTFKLSKLFFFHNKCVFICRCCFPDFFLISSHECHFKISIMFRKFYCGRYLSICRKGYFLFKLRSWRNYGCNNSFNRLKKYFNVKFLMNNKYISCKLDNLYYIIIICRNSTENRQKMQHWVFTI